MFSNHSRWGFFNQFGEFSSLAKFVGGSQEVASPFGSAAMYSLSRNNRFYQPGSDRSVPISLRAPGSPVPAQVEGQRQRRGE